MCLNERYSLGNFSDLRWLAPGEYFILTGEVGRLSQGGQAYVYEVLSYNFVGTHVRVRRLVDNLESEFGKFTAVLRLEREVMKNVREAKNT